MDEWKSVEGEHQATVARNDAVPADLTGLLRLAERAVLAGGHALTSMRRAWSTVASQEGLDIKIEADVRAQALIVDALRSASDWPILGEETGWIGGRPADDAPYWVVDPLDGTFNYHRGIPFCCSAVALCQGMRPLLGTIHDFERGELFSGATGLGMWLNHQPAAVEARPSCQGALATGFPTRSDFSTAGIGRTVEKLRSWKKIRMLGSAALSLSYVATGRLDGYAEDGIQWWDVAAGLALVQAAGGVAHWVGDDPEQPLNVTAQGSPQQDPPRIGPDAP